MTLNHDSEGEAFTILTLFGLAICYLCFLRHHYFQQMSRVEPANISSSTTAGITDGGTNIIWQRRVDRQQIPNSTNNNEETHHNSTWCPSFFAVNLPPIEIAQ